MDNYWLECIGAIAVFLWIVLSGLLAVIAFVSAKALEEEMEELDGDLKRRYDNLDNRVDKLEDFKIEHECRRAKKKKKKKEDKKC